MLLHGFGRRKRGIAEFQLCNLQCGAFYEDFLHVAFTRRICDDCMFQRALHAARCKQFLHSVDSLVYDSSGFGESAVEEGKLAADVIADSVIREPREIVKIDGPWR